jgi:hypothetical protein
VKKPIATDQTSENIALVIEMLGGAVERLGRYSKGRSQKELMTPLSKGERTPTEVLAHILHCEARGSEAIYLALMLKEPEVAPVHAERDWGKLVRYDLQPFAEMTAYFKFRRAVLMRVLSELDAKKWSRTIREAGKARRESVYWQARGLATHENEHLGELTDRP